jgi:hypothetical protein
MSADRLTSPPNPFPHGGRGNDSSGSPSAPPSPARKGAGGLGPTSPIVALLFVGEVAWLTAWSAAIGPWAGVRSPLLDPLTLGLLVGVGAWLPRRIFGGGAATDRIGAGALGVAAALLASGRYWLVSTPGLSSGEAESLAVFAVVLSLVAWWRGLRLGGSHADVAGVESAFRAGIGALALLLVTVAIVGGTLRPTPQSLVPPTLLFLGANLVALPLARVLEVRDRKSVV